MARAYRRGLRGERKARSILESQGYYVVRSAGSKGAWDLVAYRQDTTIAPPNAPLWRCIQVKMGAYTSRYEKDRLGKMLVPPGTSREIWRFKNRIAEPEITLL